MDYSQIPSEVLATLTEREKNILFYRFGLGDISEPHTLRETASYFLVNIVEVRNLEAEIVNNPLLGIPLHERPQE